MMTFLPGIKRRHIPFTEVHEFENIIILELLNHIVIDVQIIADIVEYFSSKQ